MPLTEIAEPMSSVDAAWFDMDDRRSPMVVAAVLEFTGVADVRRLGRRIVTRLLRHPRFRQHVVEQGGRRRWETGEVRQGYHLRIQPATRGAQDPTLRAAIAHELEQDLDRARPLWRVVLFPGPRGRVTALFRAHHAMADGIALMQLLLGLCDGAPRARAARPAASPPGHGPLAGVLTRLEGMNRFLELAADELSNDFHDPARLRAQLGELRKEMQAAVRVARLPDDNPRSFRAALSGRRQVAWTHGLSLAAIRRIAHRQHVSVNDVFLTALAGAFGRYLRRTDPVPESQNLRVSVPVNLRDPRDGELGNRFGLVLVDLPVGIEGWHARLDVIADRMRALKHSPEPRAVLTALWAAGHLPSSVERHLVDFVGQKAGAVVSNLPGPAKALRFGGARLAGVVFWPPQSAGIGIGVSLLSYAGLVSIGVSADVAQLAEPAQLIEDFRAEFAAMQGRAAA